MACILEDQFSRIRQSFWVPHKSKVNIAPKCDADPCGGMSMSTIPPLKKPQMLINLWKTNIYADKNAHTVKFNKTKKEKNVKLDT